MHRVISLFLIAAAALVTYPRQLRADEPALRAGEGLPLVDWKDAGKYVGRDVIVQGLIQATGRAKSITFLNFDHARSFTAIVRKRNYGNFPKSPEAMYGGKLLQIRGHITEFKNKPQIEVIRPDQITILDAPKATTSAPPVRRAAFDGIVTIATYNVLNLFDSHDNPYRSDEGTPEKPRQQLERLAETIRKVDADVLALQEVENRDYLDQFVQAMLGDMGYKHIVCIEGNDRRGIDCAVLSRFPVGPVTSYRHIRFDGGNGRKMGFRRDLLRARIEPPNASSFDIFVVHLKSKRGGHDTEPVRMAEAKAIRGILSDVVQKDAGARFVLCGDFNDTWNSNPIKTIRGEGATALRAFVEDVPKDTPTFNKAPYKSMIDFVFCSPAMASRYVADSLRVVSGTVASSGSDHNPVVMRFRLGDRPVAATEDSAAAAN